MSLPTALILSVSQLNKQIKRLLEQEVGVIYLEGEISNLSKPSSGHYYFTLKDSSAQIRCVFFKNRHSHSGATSLKEGKKIVVTGTLSLYEARGDYQLIVEKITDSGQGLLYQRFEELKNKLFTEGLFHLDRKKKLPSIPRTIGVITSPTGAALQDILSTLAARFPAALVLVYPTEVQGERAVNGVISALKQAQEDRRADVLIVARGGGSIEDLWAFNEERLLRCIASCTIPIISGIGHETDCTITDFIADHRAETPTAAACAATPHFKELLAVLTNYNKHLTRLLRTQLDNRHLRLHHLTDKLSSPKKAITSYWRTLEFMKRQLITVITKIIKQKNYQIALCLSYLNAQNPRTQVAQIQSHLNQLLEQLEQHIKIRLKDYHYHMNTLFSTLHAVSPLATLDRGYAIASYRGAVLFSAETVSPADLIEVRLAQGALLCEVQNIQ